MIATDSYSDDQYQLQSVLPLLTYVWYMCGDTARHRRKQSIVPRAIFVIYVFNMYITLISNYFIYEFIKLIILISLFEFKHTS